VKKIKVGSIIGGGAILTLGSGISAVASFVRNIIIARIVSVEDFGIAMLFALTMSAIEMASNLAIDKIIIQADDGDSEDFQSTGQAFQIMRGLLGGLILFMSAEYVAGFFNVPDVIWAFNLLALYPIIKGFSHLDIARFQREMKFLPLMWVDTIPQLITFVLAWPLAVWLGDYSVMIWLMILQVVLYVLLTHRFAVRQFRLSWNYKIAKRMYTFGWPLLVNGVFMFAILQGDKAIVGSLISMETLGWYSAAFTLTLAPTMLIMKVSQSLLLPILSQSQADKLLFEQKVEFAIQSCILAGFSLGYFFTLFGNDILIVLFGEKYNNGVVVVVWLGLMQAVRLVKSGPIIVSMAIADTKNPMISNLARALAFVIAIGAILSGYDIKTLVIIGLVGEMVAFIISISILARKSGFSLVKHLFTAGILLFLGIVLIHFDSLSLITDPLVDVILKLSVLMGSIIFCIYIMPEIRGRILRLTH